MKLVVIMAFEFPKSTKNCARYKGGLFRHVTKVMVFIVCLSPPILHGCDSNMCHQVNLIMVTGKPWIGCWFCSPERKESPLNYKLYELGRVHQEGKPERLQAYLLTPTSVSKSRAPPSPSVWTRLWAAAVFSGSQDAHSPWDGASPIRNPVVQFTYALCVQGGTVPSPW